MERSGTIHEETALFIRRGYDLSCFDMAVSALHAIGIPVIVHIILGLPGKRRTQNRFELETETELLETIDYMNQSRITRPGRGREGGA